jgi:hypothetical protein
MLERFSSEISMTIKRKVSNLNCNSVEESAMDGFAFDRHNKVKVTNSNMRMPCSINERSDYIQLDNLQRERQLTQ